MPSYWTDQILFLELQSFLDSMKEWGFTVYCQCECGELSEVYKIRLYKEGEYDKADVTRYWTNNGWSSPRIEFDFSFGTQIFTDKL